MCFDCRVSSLVLAQCRSSTSAAVRMCGVTSVWWPRVVYTSSPTHSLVTASPGERTGKWLKSKPAKLFYFTRVLYDIENGTGGVFLYDSALIIGPLCVVPYSSQLACLLPTLAVKADRKIIGICMAKSFTVRLSFIC